jgi:predicted component of type VI protein secretion system
MNVSGTGLSGSQTFTANQAGAATFTVTSNATNANTASTIVARDASGNFSAGTITATLSGNASTATSATTATNIAGGAANQIPRQSAAGTTTFITAPTTASTFLSWNGSAFAWAAVSGGVTISDDNSTNATRYLTFTSATSGSISTVNVSSTKLTYNPSTGALTSTSHVSSSDARLKINWRDLPDNLVEQLAQVKAGVYDRTDTDEPVTQVGVSAQSLQDVIPNAVVEDVDGMLSVAYGNAALVAAIELAKRVVEQEARINRLEALVARLMGD